MPEYLKVYDEILSRDWDVLVTGYFSNPATREDARIAKAYVDDVYRTMHRVQRAGNAQLYAAAAKKYGPQNIYAIGAAVIDWEIARAARELIARWSSRLESVDVWAASHCRTALVYDVWDVGANGHRA